MTTKKLTKLVSIDKTRLSGSGSFPAPQKSDIGKNVVVTRMCMTWDGCLGYFEGEDPEKKYAFWNDELEAD